MYNNFSTLVSFNFDLNRSVRQRGSKPKSPRGSPTDNRQHLSVKISPDADSAPVPVDDKLYENLRSPGGDYQAYITDDPDDGLYESYLEDGCKEDQAYEECTMAMGQDRARYVFPPILSNNAFGLLWKIMLNQHLKGSTSDHNV